MLESELSSERDEQRAAETMVDLSLKMVRQHERALEAAQSVAEERSRRIAELEARIWSLEARDQLGSALVALERLIAQQAEALGRLETGVGEIASSLSREAHGEVEAGVETRLRILQLEKENAEAAAEARLKVIQEQQRALEAYRRWHWRETLRGLMAPKLGVLYQYEPRPLDIPDRYRRVEPLAAPSGISIVTPSFNQGQFLERTIRSVLEQQYPRLQYIIQDGGSSDQSVEILERYRPVLAHAESKKDGGFANAINIGLNRSNGEIMAYLNSDDLLLPGTLHYIAEFFDRHPDVDVIYGHRVVTDEYDAEIGRWVLPPHDDEVLSWADYVPQETLFWRRRIWEKVGGAVDESFRFAVDWDLLLRFRQAGAKFVRLPRFLGAFRVHPHQKTSADMAEVGDQEMSRLRERCHGRVVSPGEVNRRVRPYLRGHVLYHKLYRLGLLRY